MSYEYLSGVIKHKENSLLNPTDIERMANANDAEEAFKVFNDTDYADNLLDVSANNFQDAINDDLNQVKELFSKHTKIEMMSFLFLKYDAHNIKLFFKEKYAEKNFNNYKISLGIEAPDKIRRRIIKGKSNEELDENVRLIIEKTEKFIGARPFPHRIDYIIDREYFHILHNIAKKIKSNYLKNLVKLQIDCANLKIFLRASVAKKPYEFVEKKFIKYGGIDLKELQNLYGKSIEKATDYFKNYFNNKCLDHIFEHFKKDCGVFWKIEGTIEDMEMAYIRKTKNIAFGPEVPVGYYYAKLNAMKNVRTIMTGKLHNIPSEDIKERLSQLF